MMLDLDKQADFVEDILLGVLKLHTQGLSEYELIQKVKTDIFDGDTRELLRDTHQLFQVHFIIYHFLYRLKQSLAESKTGSLRISALDICLLPYSQSSSQQLLEHDPLADYYLDISNLQNTSQQDVDELIGSFWKSFILPGDREEAMQVLEIEGHFDHNALTQQYRKLVMQHHPDRGGDTDRLQQINKAYRILKHSLN